MMCCLKKWLIPSLVGFGFIFGFDVLVHGHLLMADYNETMALWRTPEAMEAVAPVGMVAGFIIVLLVLKLFKVGYTDTGLMEGVRFGALIGLIIGLIMFTTYVYMPISMELAFKWLLTELIKWIGVGVIFAWTTSKCPVCSK